MRTYYNMRVVCLTAGICLVLGPLLATCNCFYTLQHGLLPNVLDSNTSLPLCPNDTGSNDSYFFGDPHNCSRFYQCSNGVPVLHECPPGLLFNVECRVCDSPFNVNCNEQPIQILYPFQDCQYGDIIANTRDDTCSSFIFCTISNYEDVEGDLMRCPQGLRFDPVRKTCDYAWNVPCDPPDTPDVGQFPFEL